MIFFLVAVICFVVSIFVDSHKTDWLAAGLAFLAAGHLLGDTWSLPFTRSGGKPQR